MADAVNAREDGNETEFGVHLWPTRPGRSATQKQYQHDDVQNQSGTRWNFHHSKTATIGFAGLQLAIGGQREKCEENHSQTPTAEAVAGSQQPDCKQDFKNWDGAEEPAW
jgi:hypothetical protein